MPSVKGYHGRSYAELKKICKKVYWNIKLGCYVYSDTGKPMDEADKERFNICCYREHGYATDIYDILSEPHYMTTEEWAEVCDDGGINFGSRREGSKIIVYID